MATCTAQAVDFQVGLVRCCSGHRTELLRLSFVRCAQALLLNPLTPLLSFSLSLTPQFVEVEGQITSLVDLYPSFLRKGYRREIFIAIVCSISYLLGLTMVTEVGGWYFGWHEGFPCLHLDLIPSHLLRGTGEMSTHHTPLGLHPSPPHP